MTARDRIEDVLERHFPIESPEGRATLEYAADQDLHVENGRVYGCIRCIRWTSEDGERRIEDVIDD